MVLSEIEKENISLIKQFKKACIGRMEYLILLARESNNLDTYSGENKYKLFRVKQVMDQARDMESMIIKNIENRLIEREAN